MTIGTITRLYWLAVRAATVFTHGTLVALCIVGALLVAAVALLTERDE
jgi:hypothetical protein